MQKVILITGASSGIGKATASLLESQGHIVYATSRSSTPPLDVTKQKQAETVVSNIIKEHGRIDVLINNAGFGQWGPVELVSLKDAQYQFDVCYFGVVRLTKLVIPHMRKQKSGTIINISSMAGKIYTPLAAHYHAVKHAVEGFSDCLRIELKQFNIDVVIVEPGLIATGFQKALKKHLKPYTKDPVYKRITSSVQQATKRAYESTTPSMPESIAIEIHKAISAKNPKTRYVQGAMAKPLLFMRKWFSDKWYDRVILRNFK